MYDNHWERASNDARFLVFEGLDHSGKTTQLSLLAQKLAVMNIPHTVTREPSDGNPVGRMTRECINGDFPLANETLALLFAADRYEHAATEIVPPLNAGVHVLCDRYYYSNFAYQGDGAALERLIAYNNRVMEGLKPDAVIFLDTEPEECVARINANQLYNPGLYENMEKLRRVRECYREAFKRLSNAENIIVIDTQGLTADETAERIWARLERYFS